jgi:hypothetical protein
MEPPENSTRAFLMCHDRGGRRQGGVDVLDGTPRSIAAPLGPERCRFLYAFHGYRPENDEQREYYRNLSAAFRIPLTEDFANFPKVQRGIASNSRAGFVLNYQERRIRHFHHVLGRYCAE